MDIYVVTTTFGEFRFAANLAEASASIYSVDDEDEADSLDMVTPFRTADARHDPFEAAVLLMGYYGADYYLNPDDDDDNLDHEEYIRSKILSVA